MVAAADVDVFLGTSNYNFKRRVMERVNMSCWTLNVRFCSFFFFNKTALEMRTVKEWPSI